MEADSILKSLAMLKDVVAGKSYDVIAAEHGVTRTAVERRVKAMAMSLNRDVGIEGINRDAVVSVQRLRRSGPEVLAAIERYAPTKLRDPRVARILTDQEIELAASRTRTRSACPCRDVALLYMLLSTGARPLEIARLEVRDYLSADGGVREESLMREEVATSGKRRPLFFASQKANACIDDYLAERRFNGFGVGSHYCYRGLDPRSRLFLSEAGSPFEIVCHGRAEQTRFLCRGIANVYRNIFRHIGIEGLSALNIRRTVAARMLERGAIESQIGELLGISDPKAVRELLPTVRWPLQAIARELV
jgi:integrase